ncbi:GntR family transcriptional regulator [Mucilaginibacter sp. cycad4]|uniref:GntR family transcriptional regulator n=1 Tax=Mucilaginibacter sp. cycad4 TaxID=3342096 RepID=UPI002AAB4227|nr:GntR family transcriptional regulator [Mucilaginibacter gossypii]WPU97200.1 GntR family transcriptional regulator [Mucilaginibacter gossypii]
MNISFNQPKLLSLCQSFKMKYSIDHRSPVPLHAQAEEILRKLITEDIYQNGKVLPNEVELAKLLAISRTTLRQAINKLVFEGLLIRKKRTGTKVNQSTVSSKSNNWLSFSQEMKLRGIAIKNFELHVTWVEPDEQLVNFFEIKPDKKLLKMERVRGKPDGPFVYFISYFHPRIGLSGDEDFKLPLYEMLEQEHSTIASLSKEEISAHAADALIADKLQIKFGEPVLVRKRFVFDQGDRPMEYNLGYYKADSFVYTVESRR